MLQDLNRVLVDLHVRDVQGDVGGRLDALHGDLHEALDREVPRDDEGGELDLVGLGDQVGGKANIGRLRMHNGMK